MLINSFDTFVVALSQHLSKVEGDLLLSTEVDERKSGLDDADNHLQSVEHVGSCCGYVDWMYLA